MLSFRGFIHRHAPIQPAAISRAVAYGLTQGYACCLIGTQADVRRILTIMVLISCRYIFTSSEDKSNRGHQEEGIERVPCGTETENDVLACGLGNRIIMNPNEYFKQKNAGCLGI
mmetsp:Transcript_68198/g.113368  ORF Transcript_68198/g.113368 Transcript_68198/m.113368 type:complete len:115 (-) Transcript_68198:258-602(-)